MMGTSEINTGNRNFLLILNDDFTILYTDYYDSSCKEGENFKKIFNVRKTATDDDLIDPVKPEDLRRMFFYNKQNSFLRYKVLSVTLYKNEYLICCRNFLLSVEDYINVYALSPVSVLITDTGGRIIFINSAFENMTGYSLEELKGKNVNFFKSGHQSSLFYSRLWSEITQGKQWSGEFLNYKKDESVLYESAFIEPLYSEVETITHYVKFSEDFTVLRKLIDLLMRSYQVIEGVMNNTSPVMLVDNNHQIILANRFFYTMTGYLSENLTGALLYDIIDKTDEDAVRKKIEKVFSESSSEEAIEISMVKPDNEVIFIHMKISILNRDQMGNNIVISMEDITEKKKTRETLAQLSYAIEQSPSTVVITDLNGNIEYVNPKFSRLTGYSFEEVKGNNPRILKSGLQDESFYKNLWETILAGKEWRGEFHNRKKNGELYWEFASISGIKNNRGEIYRFVALKEDVTERKQAEEALKISEENLRKKNYFMERELQYAQEITRNFLPASLPEKDFIKTDYRYMPLDAIGGDYFTFYHPSDSVFSLFLGDVSGHGVSAALFLALVKSVTDEIVDIHGLDPVKYISNVNQNLGSNMASYFITGIYCTFEKTGSVTKLVFAKGGHPPPILQRKDGNKAELLKSRGKPLGLFPNENFEAFDMTLYPGDRIFFYTDGINETMNEKRNMLHYDGLLRLVNRCRDETLGNALDSIIDGVHDHRGSVPLDDDIVLIGIEVV